jgi:hypothetical protein
VLFFCPRLKAALAFALLLLVVAAGIAIWLSFDLTDNRQSARRWVYQTCNSSGRVNYEEVRSFGPAAVPFLIQMLQIRDTGMRRVILRLQLNPPKWLAIIGGGFYRLSPAWLRKHFHTIRSAWEIHNRAADILSLLGPAAKPALPELIRCFQTEQSLPSLGAIEKMGPDASAALPALRAAPMNGSWYFKARVASALWNVGRETNAALNIFTAALTQTSDLGGAMMAADEAQKMDQTSRETLATILTNHLLSASDPKVRRSAAIEARDLHLQDEAIQRVLFLGIKDSDLEVRRHCGLTLWCLWPSNAVCAALGTRVFLEWAVNPGQFTLDFAQRAKNLGIDPVTAIPALKDDLNDANPNIRTQAAQALKLLDSASASPGASFQDDFAEVFIDAASEAKFGRFPFDRSVEARAIRRAGDLGAKGVVMKFFFDQPKEQAGDLSFASALTNLPVLLQACLDDAEARPNPLPDRFTFPGVSAQTQISGQSGVIPLLMFTVNAKDVGFVDFGSTQVPLLETYQSRTVKSLVVCCIELATGTRAVISPDGRMMFGDSGLRMDGRYCVIANLPATDNLDYIPFNDFLDGGIPASRIKGKIVIIGYDGPHIQSIPTSIGPIRAHRLFVYALQSIYEQIGQ